MELLGSVSSITWILVVGTFFSFLAGWSSGSNDVANAFGTSVGSKALTLGQAVCIAAVFEFLGTMLLGRVQTSAVAGSITNVAFFQQEPEMYAYGMMWALFATFVWGAFCSYMELNSSTTHSIIGAIMGFAMVHGGTDAINWALEDKSSFPPYKGMVPILLSWVISPILCALCSALLFSLIKFGVLRQKNSYKLSFYMLPFFVFLTVWLSLYFVLTKGAKKYMEEHGTEMENTKVMWVAALAGVGAGILVAVIGLPILWKRANTAMAQRAADEEAQAKGSYIEPVKAVDEMRPWAECNMLQKMWFLATYGTKVDIHDSIEEDPVVAAIHANAEQFDPKTEYAFGYLQVFSAICVSFAHGANDSAYAAGPLAGIYTVYKNGSLPKSVIPPVWISLLAAFSLVVGLATYGYNVTRAMGIKMAKLSASRGFSAELSTATMILVFSQYGIPTSTSQAITGAIIGVGACDGLKGVNWRLFLKQIVSWVFTLVFCGGLTALLFAQGVYAPSKPSGQQINEYENWIVNMTRTQIKDFNRSLYALPPFEDFDTYAKSLTLMDKTSKNYLKYKNLGTLQPKFVLPLANNMLSMVKNFTVYTIAVDTAKLDAVCLKEAGVACARPKLLDSVFAVKKPLTKAIPGTEKAIAQK